jgi:YHS domain-containing protein
VCSGKFKAGVEMIRLIILIAAIWVITQIIKQVRIPFLQADKEKEINSQIVAGEMVKDPACQVYVPKNMAIKQKINKQIYYFCSRECLEKFRESLKA